MIANKNQIELVKAKMEIVESSKAELEKSIKEQERNLRIFGGFLAIVILYAIVMFNPLLKSVSFYCSITIGVAGCVFMIWQRHQYRKLVAKLDETLMDARRIIHIHGMINTFCNLFLQIKDK